MKEIRNNIKSLDTREDVDKVLELPYLSNVIKETLRFHSPAANGLFPRVA